MRYCYADSKSIFAILSLFFALVISPRAPADELSVGAGPYPVQAATDIHYRDLFPGEDTKKPKNLLDVYVPKGVKDFPVLFFVHGGAWRTGDKNFFGIYSNLGSFLAKRGIGTVITNYRLSPAVQHPEHLKDVARAFAWTRKNIAKYGGRADQIFLCGHSAGGHLVSLLAADQAYLKAEGLDESAIKGVVSISGVYDVTWDGIKLFPNVFGSELEARRKASPVFLARPGLPPFLLIHADSDFLSCDDMSKRFCKVLRENKCEARVLEVKDRNHLSILLNATKAGDPVGEALLGFLTAKSGAATEAPARNP